MWEYGTRGQEYLYDTMISSGEVVVESDGDGDVTEALIEALRLQWAFGYPYTPKASTRTCMYDANMLR